MSKSSIDAINGMTIAPNAATMRFSVQGTMKTTCVNFEDLHKFSRENDLSCVFGAPTSINFQYSFVFTPNNNTHEYHKNHYNGGVDMDEGYMQKCYVLAYRGYSVKVRKDGKIAIISPRFQKLPAISKHIDMLSKYGVFNQIVCSRYDGLELKDSYCLNGCDIIQTMQATDRHFEFKWISKRVAKYYN